MIQSMTACCEAEKTDRDVTVNVEIRSYNSRYCDIVIRVPHVYTALEDRIKYVISERLMRGRIEVKVQVTEISEEAVQFEVNEPRAKAYYDALTRLKNLLNLSGEITVAQMSGLNGLIKPSEIKKNFESLWDTINACLIEAITGLNAMRKREGDFIAKDIRQRISWIEKQIDAIQQDSQALLQFYQEKLKERIASLTRGLVEIDPARIAQEAAFLADRSDISEEITRARSHIDQFRSIIGSDEPSGRKLNFLIQEMSREFNTMGTKSGNVNVSHTIVNVKTELEKIREQIQNVE